MKKIIVAMLALFMSVGITVAGAISMQGIERHADRYLLVNKTAEAAIYIDKKSVELEMVQAPNYEIEANRIMVDYQKNEIVVFEEKYFYNTENKDIITYVLDEKEIYNFAGKKLSEKDVYEGIQRVKKDDPRFEYGNIVFSLLYGNSFSK